jgi:hypothetical protein
MSDDVKRDATTAIFTIGSTKGVKAGEVLKEVQKEIAGKSSPGFVACLIGSEVVIETYSNAIHEKAVATMLARRANLTKENYSLAYR